MSRYAVGIDLGTTNNVLAYADLAAPEAEVALLPVPQLAAPATVEARPALPSFVYLGSGQEAAAGGLDLPWAAGRRYAIGQWAQQRSAEAPGRTVASAKSWLCHNGVDRQAAILPWDTPPDEPDLERISPVEASRRYLAHLAKAWDRAHPEAPLAAQQVVLTVPASFDASARELTREAARLAGLPDDLILLEEPQAAVYAWLAERGDAWRQTLSRGDRLLVCDVGGGTTDFTLIGVDDEAGELALRRIAVGRHLLVGGDNMDLALAHLATTAFADQGVAVDPWQSIALWHACRRAKEALLASDAPERYPVTVLGRGSRLIGGTVSVELERDAVRSLLVDGFFPATTLDERPVRSAAGLRTLGLPYENDTAVTLHLAELLTLHGQDGDPLRPTCVLFNGGVLKSTAFRQRLLAVLGTWMGTDTQPPETPPRELAGNDDLDFAVARGAAFYAHAKEHRGVRIRGGTARAYYVGIETAGLAVPGAPRPVQGLCVAPFGMEEGEEVEIPGAPMGLTVGARARFRFFSSTVRKDDAPGTLVPPFQISALEESDPMEAVLPAAEGGEDGVVPVRFRARVTELGVFELWCESTISSDRWKLELSVRDDPQAPPTSGS